MNVPRFRLLLACLVIVAGGWAGSSTAAATTLTRADIQQTRISLEVLGCDGCRVVAAQNRAGALTYKSRYRTAHGDAATLLFEVPTRRTTQMAFLVYAPFDDAARGGLPAVAVVGWADRRPGSRIGSSFASKKRPASGCWAGTRRQRIHATLQVRQVRQDFALLGPGRHSLAAAYFTRSLPQRPYTAAVKNNALHASDPSICR